MPSFLGGMVVCGYDEVEKGLYLGENDTASAKPGQEILLFPPEFEMDPADHPNLPKDIVNKAMNASWESVRTLAPHYTHWDRYAAFTCLIFISFIADYDGSHVDLVSSDVVLGYDIGKLLDTLFGQTAYHDSMSREYRAGVLFMAEKSNIKRRTSSPLFRRYINSISRPPGAWYYRARGCDMILLFIMYGALASAGYDHDISFSQQELDIICEIGIHLYDAVAFYKHRAEGETHNVFAYLDPVHRQETYRRAREVLWALETA
ncbi:hypothetical protein QBC43DRAFT_353974 [Cladorrhinum sp. PSN259]|nr:hypothetical protein QBC43DRAFT_353974 [Cladorrhinum sp. PSN259]